MLIIQNYCLILIVTSSKIDIYKTLSTMFTTISFNIRYLYIQYLNISIHTNTIGTYLLTKYTILLEHHSINSMVDQQNTDKNLSL